MTDPTKYLREDCAAKGRVMGDDLRDEAGITYRQLDYWVRIGLIECDGGNGSGSPRTFDRNEIAVAALLGRLSRLGLSPSSEVAQRAAIVARRGVGGIVTDGPITIFVA